MKSIINELWHGNIIPQEDSRTNSKEMKELLGYMSRHHEDLEKSFTDEQNETFEKFHCGQRVLCGVGPVHRFLRLRMVPVNKA